MEQQNNPENNAPSDNSALPEVQQELSKVAASPKQSILILIGICIVFGYLFFVFFLNGKSADKEVTQAPTDVTKPAETAASDIPTIPQLPEPPKLVEPSSPPPLVDAIIAPPLEVLPSPPLPVESNLSQSASLDPALPAKILDSDEARRRKEAKRKSAIVLVAGTLPKKTADQIEEEIDFKVRGNMQLVLGRGKIIDAILESAINTDFGGETRALVSRDVFSESGKVVLIPKGSRIFGTYTTGINGAYGRISVDWNRIDLVSGYTINIQSPGIDNLGRKGLQGRVDNKFKERIANSLLTSAFNIAFANALDKVIAPPQSSQAATENTAAASQLNNIALAIFNDSTKNAATKIPLICTQVQSAIPDKTSSAYTSFASVCSGLLIAPPTSNMDQNLTSLMSSVNAAATNLLTTTNTQLTPTQAQNASKQAFTDVTSAIKEMVDQQEFKPTITIDQGTPIKIYVTKDYKFPKAAISKRVMQ
jgi:type IV secretion system protein VirB10